MAVIRYVTGVNAEYFFILFPLFASLRRFAPEIRVEVCDFGLTAPQRAFLERKGLLLEAPPDLAGAHPWRCKAALGRYLDGRPWDVAFWLDADMMAVAPCGDLLSGIAQRLLAGGKPLAVCIDSLTTGEAVRIAPAPHFEAKAPSRGIVSGTTYLNSGFFACSSPGFLADWERQCREMPDENLFEQNAFNLVAHPAGFQSLDMWQWNLCAYALSSVRIEESVGETPRFVHPDGQVRILHATSHRPEDVIKQTVTLSAGGRTFEATVKLLRHPALLQWQMSLLRQGLEADAALLGESGLGRPDPGATGDADSEAKARFQKGGEMFLLRRFAEAADEFREVLRLKPGHARSLFNLAMAQAELGQLPLAPPLLRQAIQADPDYREAHIYLVMMLSRLGESEAAGKALAQALSRWPQDSTLRQMADAGDKTNNFV
ncbi:Macrocin-O-methyltransferase domain protein [Paramagnetospirillum magnetotacticum MS-1]|uniref:Macrocin-O-methyltransferase domain protein n=1 Tax=Paramagnetospirillum magnetotacticum MS-1 TaxID=272627 RepID=A0A0C2V2V4_PARME|nr:tetratricopeptide repeat protein [Paramagnetospirillum magnetotacticum]KIL99416.1 Macrocin-O-methyltransferase domain protein [Paramagnetospirillum magnetotacticum MS-1]